MRVLAFALSHIGTYNHHFIPPSHHEKCSEAKQNPQRITKPQRNLPDSIRNKWKFSPKHHLNISRNSMRCDCYTLPTCLPAHSTYLPRYVGKYTVCVMYLRTYMHAYIPTYIPLPHFLPPLHFLLHFLPPLHFLSHFLPPSLPSPLLYFLPPPLTYRLDSTRLIHSTT